ncbi:MAG: hypothetical protein RIR18_417 [Pseudomonadota bacterium]|jgi:hypothetical protein
MARTIKISGPGLQDAFAEMQVKEFGAEKALACTGGPAHEAVKRAIVRMNKTQQSDTSVPAIASYPMGSMGEAIELEGGAA